MSSGFNAYITQPGEIVMNEGRATVTVSVANTGDRAIQVGSHYHFFEANAALEFDREAAYGRHLAIPSGLAIRFEPGDTREVELVDFGGARVLYGFSNLVDGPLDDEEIREQAMRRLEDFLKNSNSEDNVAQQRITPHEE
ncbi:urease subunit beta [Corynebacterium sp. 320]|uniref:urease subunit beta n=1 Tax=Corynebacterium TaxID=1716 RepID=UPI00125CC3D3|nr:urease subunit beta [Corynebacterium sp. 320]KAB1552448.1 urease subunit beta [Corynebacterium sp. 321]KAB1554337.1 urease subunit beta [Corynebacterium sp. 319]KAB3528589.1 urease subunit beta [Corynebacterium sp. 250]KAB3539919.1 urease subunit beta [Corynebacterium sp. 366]